MESGNPFATTGLEQEIPEGTPIYFQTASTANYAVIQGQEILYQIHAPTIQGMQTVQTGQNAAQLNVGAKIKKTDKVAEQGGIAPDPNNNKGGKKSRKTKHTKEGEEEEKRKLEEKAKRLQKQLQQQRADLQQASHSRDAPTNRQEDTANAEKSREEAVFMAAGQPQGQQMFLTPDNNIVHAAAPPAEAIWQGAGPSRGVGNPTWMPQQQWQQPYPQQGGWVWQQAPRKAAKKSRSKTNVSPEQSEEEEDSDESEDSEEEKEKERKKKKDKERNWEKETPKQRAVRYRKYEKMAENTDSDKQSVKHQVSAMYRSVIAQEKMIEYLRATRNNGSSGEQAQNKKDMIEEILTARKELVERINYLEVAHDYDWDAAKVYREMREANPSSIVLKAVTEAKKRKAAGKKEPEEKRKRKAEHHGATHHGGSVNNAWRSHSNYAGFQYAAPQQQYWPQQQQFQYQMPQPQTAFAPPPPAPYGRQTNAFRPTRQGGCFYCGDSSHGFRRCPNAQSAAASSQKAGPPPPPSTPQ